MSRIKKPEGWKAPKTFSEYVADNPEGNVRWLSQHYPASNNDFDDVAQHLLLKIAEQKVVEKYDPEKRKFGSPVDSFFGWMGMNYDFELKRLYTHRNALKRVINQTAVSLDTNLMGESEDGINIDEMHLSQDYERQCLRESENLFFKVCISEFRDYVAKYRPNLLPTFDALVQGTCSRATWRTLVPKLRVLMKYFELGKKPGKNRAINAYRLRKRKSQKRWEAKNPNYNKEYYRKNREARIAYSRKRRKLNKLKKQLSKLPLRAAA